MKRIFLVISILILTLGLGYCIYQIVDFANGMKLDKAENINWQKDITGIYYVDLPPGLDTIEFKATVVLDKKKKIQKLKFPNGGTETNVFIYDSTFLKNIQTNTKVKTEPLTHGDFNRNQDVLLDISNLANGKYYVHYLSCNSGGIFPLTLK
jgi:hypothetical protein